MSEREEVVGTRERETIAVGRSSYCFGVSPFGVDSISKEVMEFSPLWFP